MRAPVHSARIAARLTASIGDNGGTRGEMRDRIGAAGSANAALAPLHDRVGLGMQRDALAGRRHDLESLEHRAGRRRGDLAERVAHVELEADHAGLDQRRHMFDRVLAEHRVEAEIDMRLLGRHLELRGEHVGRAKRSGSCSACRTRW